MHCSWCVLDCGEAQLSLMRAFDAVLRENDRFHAGSIAEVVLDL